MSDIITQLNIEVIDNPTLISVQEGPININVSELGQQGLPGPPGADGGAAGGGGISTGDADLRYYPLNSNPSGYITGFNSGQYITANQTGQFYPASNPSQFIRSGDVSSIYYTKNNESGFLNSLSGLSTGYIQSISGVLSNRLNITGSNLLNLVNSISGNFNGNYPNVLLVNPNGTYSGFYGSTDLTRGTALTGAIYSSRYGDSILLGPGNFNIGDLFDPENVIYNSIYVTSGVSLIGQGVNHTFIIANSDSQMFELEGNNTVQDLSITNLGNAGGCITFAQQENTKNYLRNLYLSGLLDCIGTDAFWNGTEINIDNVECMGRDDTFNGTASYVFIRDSKFSLIEDGIGRLISFQPVSNTGTLIVQNSIFRGNIKNISGDAILFRSDNTESSLTVAGCLIDNINTGTFIHLRNNGVGTLMVDATTKYNVNKTVGKITTLPIFGFSGYSGRFITSYESGQFYPASNPAQFVTSGNLYNTGNILDNKINSLSGYSNNNFATISNLASTGQQSYNLIIGLSGQLQATGTNLLSLINTERNKQTVTGVSITGSNSITGLVNIQGIYGTNVILSGNNIIGISGGGGGGVSNAVTSLNSLINAVQVTGLGIITVSNNGQIIQVSGSSPTGAGEVNTASNLGGGIGVFSDKSVFDLRFYSLTGITGINVTLSGNQINLNSTLNTGQFYPASNPAQFTNSGNLYSTGSNLYNYIVGLSGNLILTGQNLSAVRVTGSSILNNADFSGLNNIVISFSGSKVYISGNTGFLSNYYPISNPNQYIRSGDVSSTYATILNLQSTGQQTYNLIISLSGELNSTGTNLQTQINTERNKPTVTGVSISGGNSITGLINITGIGGLQIYQFGNNIQFSGGGGGNVTNNITNNYSINSGSGIFIYRSGIISGVSEQFINFPTTLDIKPIVIATLHNDTDNNILGYQVSGANTTGFWILFSESLPNTGYYLDIFASNSSQTGMATNVIVNNTNNITNFNSNNGVTGISITGGLAISGALKFTELGGLRIIQTENEIIFSGGAGGGGLTQQQADLLYLSTGSSGVFYSTSNPQQYISSGNVIATYATITNLALTGQQAYNLIVGLSGSLNSTGTNLQNQINNFGPYQNIVYTTGYQLINEGKAFGLHDSNFTISGNPDVSANVVFRVTTDGFVNTYYSDGSPFISSEDAIIYATTTIPSIFINDRRLGDSASQSALDWENKTLNNQWSLVGSKSIGELNAITGVSISGGNSITGIFNLLAGSNITLTQQGNNTLSIASTAAGGSLGGVTGISITGGIAISGAINLLAGNNISLSQGGNSNITITSTAVGGASISNAITGFGTVDYVPKFNAQNSGLINSNIVSIGNLVGINNPNPQDNLDISGTVLIYNNDSFNVLSATGSNSTYQQINIQNKSTNQNASSDLVATADFGNESTGYVDLGINSSTYSGGYIGYSGDAYLYSQANDFYIGNPIRNKKMIFFANNAPTGINGALMTLENNQVRISGTAFASGGQLLTTTDSGNLRAIIELTGSNLQTQLGTLNRSTCFYNSDGIPTGSYFLPIWRAPFNCTVTGVHGYIISGTNAVINARRNALNLLVSNMTISPTGAWISSGIIQNGSFVAGDTLAANIISVQDFPTSVTVQIDFRRP